MFPDSFFSRTYVLVLLTGALALGGCQLFGIDSNNEDPPHNSEEYCEQFPENCLTDSEGETPTDDR